MDFRRLFELFEYQRNRFPTEAALNVRQNQGWRAYSTAACQEEIDRVSAGMLELGLRPGERVAIMAPGGSPQWNFLDLGMQQAGLVVVPIHTAVSPSELRYILADAEVKYCVVADRDLCQRVAAARDAAPLLRDIFVLEEQPDLPGWSDLVKTPAEQHRETLRALRAAIGEDDVATLMYTSGSTGQPKGVLLSHKNIVSNIKSVIPLIPVAYDKRVFSYLPLSHVFERMVAYTYIAAGAQVYYGGQADTWLEDLRAARPHYFTAVPRVLERLRDGIAQQAARMKPWRRRVLRWAMALGEQYDETGRLGWGYRLRLSLADLLVYRHWRRALGGSVEGIVVGAAALRPQLGRMFCAAGIEVREGYGLTETSPVIAFNRFEPGGVRFGTVGIPIPGMEVKIDAPNANGEGEILVKGPNVMLGYHGERNSEVFDPDGWLRTGDLGRFTHRRFLQITGRKKNLFKTTTGKYVAPELVENALKASPYIEHCLVAGEDRPFPVAIVLPCFPLLEQWCRENQVHWTAPQFMVLNPKVLKLLREEVARCNAELSDHQQARRFHVVHQEWTAEGGELTPTLKPRRELLRAQFQKEIDALYNEK